MISHLTGKILSKEGLFLVIETGGVGYKIAVTGNATSSLKEGNISLWIHMAVRENSHELYGFLTKEELRFFELLISVSGIGPKTAMGILNAAPLETLQQAIRRGNTAHLIKVGGIGRKNAEKIVIELQEKMENFEHIPEETLREEEDVIEALTSLGYSQKEARETLKSLSGEIIGAGEKVKHALKKLGSVKRDKNN